MSAARKKKTGAKAKRPDPGLPGKPPFLAGWERTAAAAAARKTTAGDRDEPEKEKKSITLDGPRGQITVENYCPAGKIEELEVDDGICMFSRNNPERQKKALVTVAGSQDGNVVAGYAEEKLVSYIGIHHPSERERWGKPGYPWLFELGAIEVSRNYRECGLAVGMMKVAWEDAFYDDKIVITTAFTWHWDLEGTGMNKLQYRELFIDLAGRFGFMEMATDEPNVLMDSANLFMVRLGKDSSFSRYQQFASLLFTNEWEAMLRGY